MSTCRGCGGDNAPGAARCQYCDQPLQSVRALELDWDVRTGGGATGRGRLRLQAPAAVGGDAARVAVEAAFGAAMTALGPSADAARVQALMRERLPALLPPGCALEALSVESVSAFVLVGGAPDATASGARGCSLGCLALATVLCCLPWGLLGPVVAVASESDIARVRGARLVTTPEEALGGAPGPVALQGVVATIDSGAPVSPHGDPCLWLSEPDERGRAVVTSVDAFRVGELRVELDATVNWDSPVSYRHEVPGRSRTYTAIRADRPLLIVGTLQPGGLLAGDHVYVSTRATRDDLVEHLESMRRSAIVLGVAALLVTGLFVGLWLRRGRRA